MEFVRIEVEEREPKGSGAARRLRRAGRVPANLYGMGRGTISLTIGRDEIVSFIESGSHLIELKMADKTRPAILREVQVDPLSDEILHVDFNRVDTDQEIEDDVRITLKGRPKGVVEGGDLTTQLEVMRVRCKPLDIPREFIVDVSELGIGDQVAAGDLEMPERVEMVTDPDEVIAVVAVPYVEELPTPEEGAEEEEAAEPELVGKDAEEEDEEKDADAES